jgi:hypothetical protein
MRAPRLFASLALAVLFGVGCSGAASPSVASPSPAQPSAVPTTSAIEINGTTVTFIAGAAPVDCPPAKVAGVVLAFFDAFNRGDQVALRGMFGQSVVFTSPNPPPRNFFISTGQQSLLDYFAERQAQHESLRLTKLQIGYFGGARVGLAPTIDRRADDIVAEIVSAKSELNCASGGITLWAQGGWGRSPTPVPTAFTLPASCAFVGAATLTPGSNEWRIDCGVEGNGNVRAVLEPALVQQGWGFCPRAAGPAWSKYLAGVLMFVQPPPSSTELPQLIAQQQTLANCPFAP